MKYYSTRDKEAVVSVEHAISQGLSKEGGLFVPQMFPKFLAEDFYELAEADYQERAMEVMSLFLDSFNCEELLDCITSAYNKDNFDCREIAPLKKITDNTYVLELWHGPTCAFKDMALQILPKLLTYSVKKIGEKRTVVILVATSGDTGKAALEGFSDIDGTQIVVFYPNDGVSSIQRLQMVTQKGENVYVGAVNGNFDDAQNGVKAIFTDEAYKKNLSENGYVLSSANSINWGRLLPQIVYYISSYCDLIKNNEIECGDKINVCVPTGNFGNILAAYYARKIGLPIDKLICASNSNNVLTDFIKTGIYDKNREFQTTISPSMDILISSNLERLIFDLTGCDHEKTLEYMNKLKKNGKYEVDDECRKKIKELFYGGYCDDQCTKQTIKEVYDKYGYVCDTHTAVAVNVYKQYVKQTGDKKPVVIASTASPFKFNQSVLSAILGEKEIENKDDFTLLEMCSKVSGLKIPKQLSELKTAPIRFKEACEKEGMVSLINNFLLS